jgi:hypothetical protein
MIAVDTVLLDLTEWCCRRFQVLTGRTNVWLALQLTNLSIVIYFVWAGATFLSADVDVRIFIAVFCAVLLYALTQTVFKVSIETYESNAYRRVAKGLRNSRRVRDALLRVSFLFLSLCLFGLGSFINFLRLQYPELENPFRLVALGSSMVVVTTVVLYLLACDPLPPCAGKVTAWLRRAAPARAPLPSPESPSNRRAA